MKAKKILIAPSILSADFSEMGLAIKELEQAGADLIHCDVMDGHFVPNLTFGPKMIADLRRRTNLPLDVHLMITDPQKYIPVFLDAGADIVTFHREVVSDGEALGLLKLIHARGRLGGIVLNPETPVESLGSAVAGACDMILIMSVHPGFGGQTFIRSALPKLLAVREMIAASGKEILLEVDGGITEENAPEVIASGANVLVAGNTVFKASDKKSVMEKLRNPIG